MKGRILRVGKKLYDLGSSNKSFVQLARDLKLLGVKHWYFPLEINDISLINIDPYACDKEGHTLLSKDQVMRIMTELYRNPWYYLREIARIPDPGGTAVPYRANRGNIAQAWCFIHGIDSWLCLTRQQGKTQSALAIQDWAYNFGTSQSQFIFINKDGENAKENLRRLREQTKLLPEYLQFIRYVDDDGKITKATDNATTIRHPINGNSIITKSKATSYDSALNLARGLTAPILHFDEPEFTNHIKTIVANSVSTYNTAAERAKANGAMYGRIFTCTPGDLDTKPGQEAQEILDHTIEWTEKMYDWNEDELESYIRAKGETCNRIFYIEYNYRQIGKTDEWFRDISAQINDPLTVRREILLQRLHGSSLSPYPQEDIEYIVEMERKPIDELWILDYYKFDIYRKLERHIPYIVGIDCSTGTVGDNNAITILNPYTLEPDAEFESSFIGETAYEQLIIELVSKYIPKACVAIERNSVGDGIIDHLLHSKIQGRLYFDKAKDLVDENRQSYETVESMLKKHAQRKTYYGVYTQKQNREDMFAILSTRVNENKEKFITHNITRDLSRLVRTPSGKIEAGQGFHDDSIMSYLVALYVYYHGNNLAVFGITRGMNPDEPKNKGMKRPEEIDPTLVNPRLIEKVKAQMEMEKEKNWEEMMRKAAEEAQKETYKLYRSGNISNTIFDHTPDVVMDDYDEGESIDLDFFNELNSF